MRLLFDDELAPITSTVGFLEVDCETAAQAYLDWQNQLNKKYGGGEVEFEKVEGDFKTVLQLLLPLDNCRRRFLFCETDSNWTAFFDNFWQGTDAAAPMSYLAEHIGCRGARVVCVPHTLMSEEKTAKGRYGATIFEVYAPTGGHMRSVYAANDGGKWKFGQSGDPFAFERVEQYRAKRIRGRFTAEMLAEYLGHLGISAFDESFYMPTGGTGVLIRRMGAVPDYFKEYQLEDV